ncbi:hypothetical protein B0H14DRAFT_3504685 [Mycena olivaceomarginata]|nr:hypothetical protein B0H14DRAFT_3504685 [Mycena olivaceomarginata]
MTDDLSSRDNSCHHCDLCCLVHGGNQLPSAVVFDAPHKHLGEDLVLQKVVDDEWTSTGVKSTFTIHIPENPSSGVSGTPTAICGWGLRFSCSVDSASTSTSPRLLPYGRITFRTEAENLLPLDDEPFFTEIDLPDAAGPASIAISVQLPAGMGMTLSRKFCAYTRAGARYVSRPRPMFTKLALLRGHSDSLDAYFLGVSGAAESAESKMLDLDMDMPPEERFQEYDYMSDSDLDSDDEEEGVPTDKTARTSTTSAAQLPLPASRSSSPGSSSRPTPNGPHGRNKGTCIQNVECYLYTNKIIFCTSDSHQHSFSPTPECSAKSMYKLADRFGLDELKTLALESLQSQLSAENIVREAFSSFTSL